MYNVTDGMNIEMPQGDSAVIPFVFYTESGTVETPYILAAGQYALLTIKPFQSAPGKIKIKVTADAQEEDGTCYFEITPDMSDSLMLGEYIYSLALHNSDDSVIDTWVKAKFIIE